MPVPTEVPPFLRASISLQQQQLASSSLHAARFDASRLHLEGLSALSSSPPRASSEPLADDTPSPGTPAKQRQASISWLSLRHDSAPPAGLATLAAQALVVPPLNFDMLAPGVYRSGHPNERNFGFMAGLELKCVMYLATDDYRPHVAAWAEASSVRVLHHRLNVNKEPFGEMSPEVVAAALSDVLDKRNLPMLIHCNKGKYRVGVLAALLRRLQGWTLTSVWSEYERFAQSRIADEEFIELFDLSTVRIDKEHRPDWL